MYHTYILQSQKTGRLYIGQTKNVEARLERHNRGGTPSTRGERPWKLLHAEPFETRAEAVRLESQLKGFKRHDRVLAWIARRQ